MQVASHPRTSARWPLAALVAAAAVVVAACNSSSSSAPEAPAAIPFTVPKATCGASDVVEKDLQGQVSAAVRNAGFKGYNCNLNLIGQVRDEGAGWQYAWFTDRAGHICGYHDTSAATDNRTNVGTRVIDQSNPAAPKITAYLSTTSMIDSWESLKVNERRQMLAGVQANNGSGGPNIGIYDLSGDCRNPQLLADKPVGLDNGTGQYFIGSMVGHEGNWAPDGLTYYGGNLGNGYIYPIDVSNPTNPRLITQYFTSPGRVHGMNISDDGSRLYEASAGQGGPARAAGVPQNNGLVILDVSAVTARVIPNPPIKVVGVVTWDDGGTSQHEINTIINGHKYVIHADEAGSGGNSATGWAAACAASTPSNPLPAWQYARIIDVSNENSPFVVSKLILEAYDPKYCAQVIPDLAGLSAFTYGSHYCSVDNRNNATTLACGYFNSGIRVFDIRDPLRPKEIAYFNPPGTTTSSPGSNHLRAGGWVAGWPDWCAGQIRMDASAATLSTTCQDNGFLSLKFSNNAWPFPTSTTPPGLQN